MSLRDLGGFFNLADIRATVARTSLWRPSAMSLANSWSGVAICGATRPSGMRASKVGDVSGNDDGRACFDRGGEVPKIVGVRARQSGCQRFVVGLQNSACGVRGDSVAKYLGFRRRQAFAFDEDMFDLVEEVIRDAKVEEAIVNAGQHKVGESNWIEDVGVDEDERCRAFGWRRQYSRPPSRSAAIALSVLVRRRFRSVAKASTSETRMVRCVDPGLRLNGRRPLARRRSTNCRDTPRMWAASAGDTSSSEVT